MYTKNIEFVPSAVNLIRKSHFGFKFL